MTLSHEAPPVERSDPAPLTAERQRPVRRRRRNPLERVTASMVIGLVAALLAFSLTALLLRDRREMVAVAVATERIPAGATITSSMVRSVQMPTSVSFSGDLVPFADVRDGAVAARTVQPGEPLTRSAVGSAAGSNGSRVMAIPVESWQAVGGEVDVGDQVDVIDTGSDVPRYVLTAASVVGRATADSGGGIVASSSGKLWLNVEVTAAQALDLAAVVDAGKFVIVRSTGAPSAPVSTDVPVTTVTG